MSFSASIRHFTVQLTAGRRHAKVNGGLVVRLRWGVLRSSTADEGVIMEGNATDEAAGDFRRKRFPPLCRAAWAVVNRRAS